MNVNLLNVNANGNGHSVGILGLNANVNVNSKTTHLPHQFSQNLSKTSFIPSLFFNSILLLKIASSIITFPINNTNYI
jgi:hypothetical protein